MKIIRNWPRSESGNVTVMFAISAIAVLIASGSAIDYGRRTSWAVRLQTAADSAALAAASIEGTAAARQVAALSYFKSNFPHDSVISDPAVIVTQTDETVTVSATADLDASFMGLAGFKTLPIHAFSVASTGDTAVEIALALDVSGSMRHTLSSSKSRIDVLKLAATDLVNTVSNTGKKMKRVKVGVVPFNMNVNIGVGKTEYVQETANPLFANQAWAGCVMERSSPEINTDTYNGSTGTKGKWYAYAWPPEPNNSRSCLNKSDGTNTGYAAIDKPAGYAVQTRGPNYNCVRHPIMPLSSDYSAIIGKINVLTAEWNMGTIIAPGIAWGMRVLSPGEPFSEGAAYSGKVKKYLIVLTDGELTTEAEYGVQGSCSSARNTSKSYHYNPSTVGLLGNSLSTTGPQDTFSAYGYVRDSNPFKSNPKNWKDVNTDLYNVSLDACNEAKATSTANGIEIFTIALSDDAGEGTTVATLLKKCASSENNFFIATSDEELKDAFKSIAAKISSIRLTN